MTVITVSELQRRIFEREGRVERDTEQRLKELQREAAIVDTQIREIQFASRIGEKADLKISREWAAWQENESARQKARAEGNRLMAGTPMAPPQAVDKARLDEVCATFGISGGATFGARTGQVRQNVDIACMAGEQEVVRYAKAQRARDLMRKYPEVAELIELLREF